MCVVAVTCGRRHRQVDCCPTSRLHTIPVSPQRSDVTSQSSSSTVFLFRPFLSIYIAYSVRRPSLKEGHKIKPSHSRRYYSSAVTILVQSLSIFNTSLVLDLPHHYHLGISAEETRQLTGSLSTRPLWSFFVLSGSIKSQSNQATPPFAKLKQLNSAPANQQGQSSRPSSKVR